MPTTFNVFFLGTTGDLDPVEGNFTAENAGALVGATAGSAAEPLAGRVQELTPGTPGPTADGNAVYNQNNAAGSDTFRIDGGPQLTFDSTVNYDATITYLDGTTADVTAVLFQATNGQVWLAPEFSANADQAALEAGPIQSITLNGVAGARFSGLFADRQAGDYVPCFAAGTRIETPYGPRDVAGLRAGSLVRTADRGWEAVRWLGRTRTRATARTRPVRFRAGALGAGLPRRDLLVSPQHRMLVRSPIARRMTEAPEILVRAKKLVGLPGIARAEEVDEVEYLHLMLDRHEVVYAEGAPCESFLPGPMGLAALGPQARAEVLALFPEVADARPAPVRPILEGGAQARLVARHARNRKPLLRA
ncbi:Hint domain-containing protein [Jannaschia sp. Os4]|uniref:Hint domain-containing protein n=1 Tax=Jannaschia sp. Os4 TaxID=2807617 RepID=UPI001939917F|nr:Hint domain-containing protein [Jannaschia sp. Os4]MBM2577161.1 Hint domain-containing protein [Jannaschia sp. Os4]